MNRNNAECQTPEGSQENKPETQDDIRITISESRKRKKVLLVNPKSQPTYWSYDYCLPYVQKKAAYAPLGLITLAGMLPKNWDLSLADLSTGPLQQDELENSDAVFLGGMHIQAKSFHEEAKRAQRAGKVVVGGGPYVTSSPEECENIDHLVIGEAEGGIKEWCEAFEQGRAPKVAEMEPFPSLLKTPLPRYDLLKINDYSSMGLQLGRGCPQNCEFCSVTKLNGRVPRLKTTEQFLTEIEALYETGYTGSVFIVDDNFIGNRKEVEKKLPKIAAWQKEHGYPFDFFTQADLRLAKSDAFMAKMVEAGFSGVFLGIETPSKKALQEAGKNQNVNVDLDKAVRKITKAGLECMAGFIVGFDSDNEESLDELGHFISRNPIPQAMVGVLQASPQTDLLKRMEAEGRMLDSFDGEQFGVANFKTVMEASKLREGYAKILKNIYAPKAYFDRCLQLLRMRDNPRHALYKKRLIFGLKALKNSLLRQGLKSSYRTDYWRFLATVALTMPSKFHTAITQAIKLAHYYRFTHEDVMPRLA